MRDALKSLFVDGKSTAIVRAMVARPVHSACEERAASCCHRGAACDSRELGCRHVRTDLQTAAALTQEAGSHLMRRRCDRPKMLLTAPCIDSGRRHAH